MNYNKDDFERLTKNYELDSIDFYIDIAQKDFRIIQDYLAEAEKQKEKVKNTAFACHVYIKRESYHKVQYFVGLKIYPLIPENEKRINIYTTTENESFAGKDKKKAKEYAEMLAEKHNCKITENEIR